MVFYAIVVMFQMTLLMNKSTNIVMDDWKLDDNPFQLLKQILINSTS